jgi:hypothetical protein
VFAFACFQPAITAPQKKNESFVPIFVRSSPIIFQQIFPRCEKITTFGRFINPKTVAPEQTATGNGS